MPAAPAESPSRHPERPADMASSPDRSGWRAAFLARAVWVRAVKVAVPVGLLQICINQGDHWLAGNFTANVVIKSFVTPLVALAVALIAAAGAYRDSHSAK